MDNQLTPQPNAWLAYSKLREIAHRLMANERVGHTLCATEVVHEAMIRLMKTEPDAFMTALPSDGVQFLTFVRNAVHAMGQVLIDHSRKRGAFKRGGGRKRLDLDNIDQAIDAPGFDWLVLDEALRELQQHDPRRNAVVVLKFFAGLNNPQIAAQLGIDERTVNRDWVAARAWLKTRLADSEDGASGAATTKDDVPPT